MERDERYYLGRLLTKISEAEAKGKSGVFEINAKISDNVAKYVESYFKDKPQYELETRRCKGCSGTWDLMIFFRKF